MSWWSRVTRALHSRGLDDEIAEELRLHLDRRVDDLIHVGLTPAEAEARARREFGNVARLQEEVREAHVWIGLEGALADARRTIRSWRRRPLAIITVSASIGVATGAVIAVYTLINSSILKPLPVVRPDGLVALSVGGTRDAAPPGDAGLFSYPLYEALRAAAGDSARLTLLDDPHPAEVQDPRGDGHSERAVSQFVAPDFFRVLEVPVLVGESFTADVDGPAAPLEVMLSHDYWVRRFGADRAVVGHSLIVDGRAHVILGVAAAGFHGAARGTFIDLWRSIRTFDPAVFRNPNFRSFRLMARLSPGRSRVELNSRLSAVFRQFQEGRIGSERSRLSPADIAWLHDAGLVVASGRTGVSSLQRTTVTPLWIVFGLTSAILLLASANVAGLMLASATTRGREVVLRMALGASRARVIGLFAIEGALLALVGTGLGLAIAPVLAHALLVNLGGDHPLQLDLSGDVRVWGFAAGLAGLATVIIGGLPAWRILVGRPLISMRHTGRQMLGGGSSRALVAIQIAFAFSLVVSGAAFVVSLRHLTAVPLGFDAGNVAVFTMADDVGASQRPLQLQLMRDLEARVSAHAEVAGAAAAWWALFSDARRAQRVSLPGGSLSDDQEVFYRVSPQYLATLRVPLLSGRNFTPADNDDEPVAAVISRAFALKYFGIESPLGRLFVRDDGVQHEVVGVAGDSLYDSLRAGPLPMVYMPMKPTSVFTFYVRPSRTGGDLASLVATEARVLGFQMRIRDATTLDALVDQTVATDRLLAQIGGGCAVLGLGLAALGLFGLLNHAVTGRTGEIGVRSALGATRGRIAMLILHDVAWPIAVGLTGGALVSFAAMHAMRSLFFNLLPTSPVVLGNALAAFAMTAVLACAGPVWRATAIDPAAALRRE